MYMWVEKDIFQELIRFYSMTILATPKDHNPDRGAMNFTSLLEGFVDIITMHLVFPHVTCVEVYLKIMEYLSFILF